MRAASNAVELELFNDKGNARLEALRDASFLFGLGLENRATFLRAASAKGAMFQLSILASLIGDLRSYAAPALAKTVPEDWRPDAPKATSDKATRLLYSIAGYLEAVSGLTLEDAAGDFWMARRFDPFEHLSEALGFAGEEAERGAAVEGGER
ncbi:MAG: hypothetical protein EKK29_17295 [Hyphomicrobiales bacterium]|nr:MAG: hypothetical protein EKK29_17295 [Hyphomicrobiales bacterium]